MSGNEVNAEIGAGMKWKADLLKCQIRLVAAGSYPDHDSEGDQVFDNTHFTSRDEALEQLRSEAESCVCLAGMAVQRAYEDLHKANVAAGEAAERFERVTQYLKLAARVRPGTGPSGGGPHG